jgi:SOS response regulatory protein OraA/RecX
MTNKYIISESQLKILVDKKKKDKKIAKEILNKLEKYESLNESKIRKSVINTMIETYNRKGLLNKGVLNLLKKNINK